MLESFATSLEWLIVEHHGVVRISPMKPRLKPTWADSWNAASIKMRARTIIFHKSKPSIRVEVNQTSSNPKIFLNCSPMLRSKGVPGSGVILFPFGLVFGILGFHSIEGSSYLDSAYINHDHDEHHLGFEVLGGEGFSNDGKLFVIFLIIFTIGFFTYTVSTITSFMVEGEIRNLIKGYRVTKEISKMHDHIIICGLGRNGQAGGHRTHG